MRMEKQNSLKLFVLLAFVVHACIGQGRQGIQLAIFVFYGNILSSVYSQ